MKNIKISDNDKNQTVIKFLNKYLDKAPNSLIYKWIRTKKIKVNKKRTEASQVLKLGDILNIYIYDEELEKWIENKKEIKSKINLDIAFENDDIIIFDKPQNVLVHAASSEDYGKNIVDHMVSLLIAKNEYNPRLEKTFRPAVVNRIDRNTMGLVIGAKNRNSLLKLNENKNSIHKYYLAIVHGKISKKIEIKERLSKDENNFVYISDEGKDSISIVNPIFYDEKYSLVEIHLLTGRTHQIRAGLSSIGHPVLGDRRYGIRDNSRKYKDQQLVAYKLVFDKNIGIDSIENLMVESKYKKYIYDLYNKIRGN